MRGVLAASALVLATLGSIVSSDAQDMSGRWTGCYVGGQFGGLWIDEGWVNRTEGGAHFNEFLGGHESSGLLGGIQAGCNYQFAGGLVLGVQGDYALTSAEGSHPSAQETGVFYHSRANSLATITGRVGYGWDRFLAYAKAGAAFEQDDYWATTLILGTAYTSHDVRLGWTFGIGGEYALTDAISLFIEYDHFDFGTSEIAFTPQVDGLRPAFVDIAETKGVLRAGVNFRFH